MWGDFKGIHLGSMAISSAIMAITTNSSMSVNPLSTFLKRMICPPMSPGHRIRDVPSGFINAAHARYHLYSAIARGRNSRVVAVDPAIFLVTMADHHAHSVKTQRRPFHRDRDVLKAMSQLGHIRVFLNILASWRKIGVKTRYIIGGMAWSPRAVPTP